MTLSVTLSHAFPGFTLDAAFEAPAGITVLFGRSGSGKTTVANAVAGLLRPDAGRIALDDVVLSDSARGVWLPPHRRRLGYIFQEGRLFPHLTVRQNLTYGRRFAPRGQRSDRVGHVVEMLGIGPLLDRRPGALSGGEKQRVGIGRALLASPRLILADEPLAALDDARKAEVLPYFERLRDEVAVPILYVSHSVAEVARLATSVVVLEDGQVVRHGSVRDVLGDSSVTPLGAREAGALIEARVVAHAADGLTELRAGDISLFLPRIAHPPGSAVRLRIAAHDVTLSTVAPVGQSALNILPGHVTGIRPGDGPGAIVSLDTSAGTILARITRRSVATLGLDAGMPCHAIVKSVAIAPQDIGRQPGGPT
ncbi:molybdenum ABC transporter ATP-binding protein [Roseisalinus antarcticus]|uniref:Sulfate/thiosulfate import ATP-binding protein CysA n=1 Tax=Roseisalinus antarcticus TaxID=254357 RepID=A0A1Y5S7E0_9RHOB|nr:molybdenum ABC transporter ATP-binding protein [Roseisalinus antarcticus]SLN34131.1 Sulfate/thiosulfate import ATP-binding protein CysA [Roseisalinus antarcticus]